MRLPSSIASIEAISSAVGPSSGTAGTAGTSGIGGSSGTSGTSGADGSSGTSGTAGADGSSGTTGFSGTSGISGNQAFTLGPITQISDPNNVYSKDGGGNTSGTAASSNSVLLSIAKIDGAGNNWESYLQNILPGGTLTLSNSDGDPAIVYNVTQALGAGVSPAPNSNFYTFGVEYASGATTISYTFNSAVYTITSPSAGSSSGTSGTSGIAGSSGTSGTAVNAGTSGTSGESGSSGTAGTTGTAGTSGGAGGDGSSGTSSNSGSSGTTGTAGTSGGIGGTSGTSVTAGTSGTTGTGGISGTSGISAGQAFTLGPITQLAFNSTGQIQAITAGGSRPGEADTNSVIISISQYDGNLTNNEALLSLVLPGGTLTIENPGAPNAGPIVYNVTSILGYEIIGPGGTRYYKYGVSYSSGTIVDAIADEDEDEYVTENEPDGDDLI